MKKLLILFILLLASTAGAADYPITSATSLVDGDTFCGGSACTSSDTLIIAAGARGGLMFQDLNGNGSYITIKNEVVSPSTPVTITNNNAAGWGVVTIKNCKYIDFRGDNDSALITTTKSKGIIVRNPGTWEGTGGGVLEAQGAALWIHGVASDHIKISYLELDGRNAAYGSDINSYNITNAGMGINMNDGTTETDAEYTDMEFAHIWIHDTPNQGAYFGPNDPYHRQEGEFGIKKTAHLKRFTVHDCILEDIGTEGWNLKSFDAGPNEFYNNQILRTGTETYAEASGAEIVTGTLIARNVYKITATQLNHFGTGYVVGREFVATGAETCDANNKVQAVIGGKWAVYKNYGDMQVGMKITWATHGAVFNVHDNYFEATGGPSILASGAYTHDQLLLIDGDLGGRIFVYDNIVTNAGIHGGPVPYLGWLNGDPFPQFQCAVSSEYNNYHMDVHDNIIVQPNQYGLVVVWSGDVMTANRNIIAEAGTAENSVHASGIYTEGTGVNANLVYATVADVGFTTWTDDDDYSNDVFVVGEPPPEEAETCDSCNSTNDSEIVAAANEAGGDYSSSSAWMAQPFTLAAEKCITGVTYIVGDSAANRNVTCEIYTDGSGNPGTIVGAGYTATITNISDSRTKQEFLFAETQTLAAGNYHVVCKPSNVVYYTYDTSPATASKYSFNSGSSWTTYASGVIISVLGGTPTETAVLTAVPLIRNMVSDSGSAVIDISNTGTGTMAWTAEVTTGGAWLSITDGASGSNGGTITLAATANTGEERTGVVTITSAGTAGSPETVDVVQAAPPVPEAETPLAATTGITIVKGDPTSISWDAVAGAAGYKIRHYNTATGETENFLSVNETTEGSAALSITTTTEPCFVAVHAYSATGLLGYPLEIECHVVATTTTGNATLDWDTYQIVEDGGTHTLTVTPSAGYAMTAYRIDGGSWVDNPAVNTIELVEVAADKTIEIITQRMPTVKP